jgi:hypothetical protein
MTPEEIETHFHEQMLEMQSYKEGKIRATKGFMVENISSYFVRYAWDNMLKNDPKRLVIKTQEKIKVPISLLPNIDNYLKVVDEQTAEKLKTEEIFYGIGVDVHVYVDNKFVIAIECKSYCDNAMFKRVLSDFKEIIDIFPDCNFCLFQLEDAMGGKNPNAEYLPSLNTHALLSRFPDVRMKIITLFEGKRNWEKPLHTYPKQFNMDFINNYLNYFVSVLDNDNNN